MRRLDSRHPPDLLLTIAVVLVNVANHLNRICFYMSWAGMPTLAVILDGFSKHGQESNHCVPTVLVNITINTTKAAMIKVSCSLLVNRP